MSQKKREREWKDILLLYPPFSDVGGPNISIPVLTSYLRSKNIPVSGFDLNREFFFRFLDRENIVTGKHFVHQRFMELNGRRELRSSEAYEYWILYEILAEMEEKQEKLDVLSFPFFDFSDIQDSQIGSLLTQLAFMPYFPETLLVKPRLRFAFSLDEFTSSDIVRAADRRHFYLPLLEKIVMEVINQRKPGIIGFSVVFQHQVFPAFQCARLIRKSFPHIYITMGGPFISIHFCKVNRKDLFKIVDSFILDEGEIPLERLWSEFSTGRPDFKNVPAMVYLGDNAICFNDPAPPLDLEKSPPPDYSVFQLDKYIRKKRMVVAPFRLSKGCQWRRCSFCRTNLSLWKNFQQPSYPVMYRQLKEVVETTGIRAFQFSDESFDPGMLAYISRRLIKEKLKIRWYSHTRVSRDLDRERCLLYRQAGCLSFALGIESLSDRVLRLMRKGIYVGLIDRVLRTIGGVVPITAYIMVGFPTETDEEVRSNYDKIYSYVYNGLVSFVDFNIFIIYYGSDIWDNPGKYGVSDMYFLPGQDLLPNVARFRCPGTSRSQAFRYYTTFSNAVKTDINGNGREITMEGRRVALRYPLDKIRQQHLQRWEVLYLPFVRWLAEGDQQLPPVKSMCV
jgi:radical SAM superfamily enzyme YgiQ (UPF0313 family)